MPLDHLSLQPQIKAYAQAAHAAGKRQAEKLSLAQQMLRACAADPQPAWREALAASGERCALPTHEALDCAFPTPNDPQDYILLAADGSQIIPSSHDALALALVNASLVSLPGGGCAPTVALRTHLLQEKEDGLEFEQINPDLINLRRDVTELEIMLDWQPSANDVQNPVVALRDGSLELFHEPHAAHKAGFEGAFAAYQAHMLRLSARGFILAGYIDRSRATLLTRMLELHAAQRDCLAGLRDLALMQTLLPPGGRSALFELHSSASARYQPDLRVHFFYINVGGQGKPSIARVEVPAWVARQPAAIALLHQALMEQCALMGTRPYPYLLHRAHEEAVVRFEEKDGLINALSLEMQRLGFEPPQPSNKLAAKQLSTRRRR